MELGAGFWVTVGAMGSALGWAVVRRFRRARRVLPRARLRLQLSLRTPETDPPPVLEAKPPQRAPTSLWPDVDVRELDERRELDDRDKRPARPRDDDDDDTPPHGRRRHHGRR